MSHKRYVIVGWLIRFLMDDMGRRSNARIPSYVCNMILRGKSFISLVGGKACRDLDIGHKMVVVGFCLIVYKKRVWLVIFHNRIVHYFGSAT